MLSNDSQLLNHANWDNLYSLGGFARLSELTKGLVSVQSSISANDHTGASELPPFVLGQYLLALVDAYGACGGNLKDLADSCGLSVNFLYAPPEKVSIECYFELIQAAKTLTEEPLFGLNIGGSMNVGSFDILGQAMMKAETLGQATEQVLTLEGLVHRLGHSELVSEADGVRYIWHNHYQRHPLAADLSESILAGIVKFAATLIGRSIPILEVSFLHRAAAQANQNQYAQALGGSCLFGQPQNSLLVANEVLAWPVASTVAQKFGRASGKPLQKTFTTDLRQHLEQVLNQGNPLLTAVADHFHVSPRTLQRNLKKEGTHYQVVLNELRCRLATDYLRYSNLSLHEISHLLGFAEQSSFNHFFLAQFKHSPQRYKLDVS